MLSPKFLAASILALGLGDAPVFAQDETPTDAEAQFRQLDEHNRDTSLASTSRPIRRSHNGSPSSKRTRTANAIGLSSRRSSRA
jgi:hypothetical protein